MDRSPRTPLGTRRTIAAVREVRKAVAISVGAPVVTKNRPLSGRDGHCLRRGWIVRLRDSGHAVGVVLQSISLDRENKSGDEFGAKMVKLVVRDRETIQEAVRRFRKLVERSGIKKEMRRREYYEKPSETNRRTRLRAERRARRTRLLGR